MYTQVHLSLTIRLGPQTCSQYYIGIYTLLILYLATRVGSRLITYSTEDSMRLTVYILPRQQGL